MVYTCWKAAQLKLAPHTPSLQAESAANTVAGIDLGTSNSCIAVNARAISLLPPQELHTDSKKCRCLREATLQRCCRCTAVANVPCPLSSIFQSLERQWWAIRHSGALFHSSPGLPVQQADKLEREPKELLTCSLATSDPQNTFYSVKRFIGRDFEDVHANVAQVRVCACQLILFQPMLKIMIHIIINSKECFRNGLCRQSKQRLNT